MRWFREFTYIYVFVSAALDIVVCRPQKHREVVLPCRLTVPLQPAVQMAAMLAMVAYKASDVHHPRSISHEQCEEYLGMYVMLQGSIPDPEPFLL